MTMLPRDVLLPVARPPPPSISQLSGTIQCCRSLLGKCGMVDSSDLMA